jgi:hypothetical protein
MADEVHEEELFRAFLKPSARKRFLALRKSPKGREKLRRSLPHFRKLDPRFSQRLPESVVDGRALVDLLRQRGAPAMCHVVAEDEVLDGRTMALEEAVRAVYGGGMGAFISAVPGRLAYYEGEEAGECWILER